MIRLRTLEDFQTHLPSGFTQVSDSTNIAPNTFAWNSSYRALRINDASTSLKGSITVTDFAKVSMGDVVEISAEVMNISGEKVKLGVDLINPFNSLGFVQSSSYDEFERFGARFVITKEQTVNAVIGVFTADIGDFYIRNVEIKIE